MPTPLFFRKPPNERIKRTETKDLQAMERDILLDNFALLIVRQAIRFPLVGERPKPPKNPDGCFRLPSKVRQALRRSAQKKCRRQYRNDTACIFLSCWRSLFVHIAKC